MCLYEISLATYYITQHKKLKINTIHIRFHVTKSESVVATRVTVNLNSMFHLFLSLMGLMCLLRPKYIFFKKLYTKPRESGRRATIPVQSNVNRNPIVSPVTNDSDQCQLEAIVFGEDISLIRRRYEN